MVTGVGNWAHERLFEQALDRIKVHGVLEYQGEFGGEIANFIPFVNWLYLHEYLRNARVSTYRGMEPFYFFLQPDQILTRNERRTYLAESLFLNTVKYENDKLEAYMRKLTK